MKVRTNAGLQSAGTTSAGCESQATADRRGPRRGPSAIVSTGQMPAAKTSWASAPARRLERSSFRRRPRGRSSARSEPAAFEAHSQRCAVPLQARREFDRPPRWAPCAGCCGRGAVRPGQERAVRARTLRPAARSLADEPRAAATASARGLAYLRHHTLAQLAVVARGGGFAPRVGCLNGAAGRCTVLLIMPQPFPRLVVRRRTSLTALDKTLCDRRTLLLGGFAHR